MVLSLRMSRHALSARSRARASRVRSVTLSRVSLMVGRKIQVEGAIISTTYMTVIREDLLVISYFRR